MIRQAPRCLFRVPIPSLRSAPSRRFLSTAPPAQKSRSWKNSATRWGLAIGVAYYSYTSTLFAEEPPFAVPPPTSPSDETSLATLESVRPNRQKSSPVSVPPTESTEPATLEEREQEALQEGAFNEETGEINWDCPCLGGMAHGPCGEHFRAAFSCFVFSKEEPKGMDCIENFKTMQTCFREHPDIYGSELEEGEDAPPTQDAPASAPTPSPDPADEPIPAAAISATSEPRSPPSSSPDLGPSTSDTERAVAAKEQVERDHGEATSESDEMVPKAAHDATGAAGGK